MGRAPAEGLYPATRGTCISYMLRRSTYSITFTQEKIMLAILKPIILSFAKSEKFKIFVIQCLEKLVAQTDNKLDDQAVAVVKKGLGIV